MNEFSNKTTNLTRLEIAERMRNTTMENSLEMGFRTKQNQDMFSYDSAPDLQRIFQTTRLIMAALLTAGVIFLDKTQTNLGILNADRIYHSLETDYEQTITELLDTVIKNAGDLK